MQGYAKITLAFIFQEVYNSSVLKTEFTPQVKKVDEPLSICGLWDNYTHLQPGWKEAFRILKANSKEEKEK